MVISPSFLLGIRNVSDKSCRDFMFNFFKSCRVWDNVEKRGTAGQATEDRIIWRMRVECWITKVDTQSSSSSSSCSWRVRRVSCSVILKIKLVLHLFFGCPMFLRPFGLYRFVLLFYLCPSSVRVVATFSGTVLFPLLCSMFPFFP